MSSNIVFLDFDGVLFDTVREAYAVAKLSLDRNSAIDDIDFEGNEYGYFNKYRYLISEAYEYYPLMFCIRDNVKPSSIKECFNKYSHIQDHKDDYKKMFYNQRDELKSSVDRHKWNDFNAPYPFFYSVQKIINSHSDNFIIVTTKDKLTVRKLLGYYGVKSKITIYDNKDYDAYGSKGKIIDYHCNKYGVKSALFLDDMKKHLDSLSTNSSVNPILCTWGYNEEKELSAHSSEIKLQIVRLIDI